jgi:hypothetical protein
MIREAVLFGGILYILIMVAQILQRPLIWAECLVVSVALAAATAMYLMKDKHRLHTSEIAALWAAVLLFVLYGFMKFGGLL